MSTSHLDRKELKRPDAFLEKAGGVMEFVQANARAFLVAVALLFVIGLGVAFYTTAQNRRNQQASAELYVAKKALTPVLKTTEDWEKTASKELQAVSDVAKKYSGTQAGYEAYLLIGDTYFDHGNSSRAAEEYKQAVGAAPNRTMKLLAQHSYAYALENAKNYDGAIDALRQIVNSGDKALRGDALMALARNYELKGDKTKAIEQYDLISKDFPNSELGKNAEVAKSRLK
jgi:predicted negative regulator of RcsB-dependent stress response